MGKSKAPVICSQKTSHNLEMKNLNRKSHAIYRVLRPRKIHETFFTSNISFNLCIAIILVGDSLSCLGKGPSQRIPIAISLFQACERPFRVRTLGPLTGVGYSAVSKSSGLLRIFFFPASLFYSLFFYKHYRFQMHFLK